MSSTTQKGCDDVERARRKKRVPLRSVPRRCSRGESPVLVHPQVQRIELTTAAWHVGGKHVARVGTEPPRLGDRALRRTLEVAGTEAVEVRDHRRDARPELRDGGLVVLVLGGVLAGEERGGELCRVARALHLAHEGKLVGREALDEEGVGVELLLLGEGGGLLEPGVELEEVLLHLLEHVENHVADLSRNGPSAHQGQSCSKASEKESRGRVGWRSMR